MPETVCVTVEQLRGWMNAVMKTSIRHLSDPQEVQFFADQFRSLEEAIAQAERLKDWKPKVGDRVRLRAMPEAGVWEVIETLGRMCRIKETRESALVFGIDNQWRERAELMPEEGE